MGSTGERSIGMFFFVFFTSVELDLMEIIHPKTRFMHTLLVQKNTAKENRGSPWKKKQRKKQKKINAQVLRVFLRILRDFDAYLTRPKMTVILFPRQLQQNINFYKRTQKLGGF